MSFLSSFRDYGDLPKLWGRSFMPLAFVGRLPTSMIIIGVLTLITAVRGIGLAALMSAVLAISIGIFQPLVGKWTDRAGQRVPLLVLAPINAASLIALIFAQNAPVPVLTMVCALVGGSTVPVGGLMRVRWYPVARTPRSLASALSYETVADELNFVLGPAFVGLLASAFNPTLPIAITAGISALCITSLALHPSCPQRPEIRDDEAPAILTVARRVAVALAAMCCLGAFFGAMQTSTTAAATHFGSASTAGLIYSAMGAGAALTALGSVAIPERIDQRLRIGLGGLVMVGLTLLTPLAGSAPQLALILFFLGMGIGPASVAMFTLAGQLAPKGGDGVAMTAIGSANVVGVAAGAALAGKVLPHSLAGGFHLGTGAALAMAVVGLTAAVNHRRAR